MNSTPKLHALIHFRSEMYQTFERAADALMNTIDALLTENQAQSLPELSLSPLFERKWHSLYEAFEDGQIEKRRLRETFANHAPWPTDERIVLALDASSIARPKSKTARDRTLVHEANLPPGCPPVVPGWQFSTLVLLPQTPSSWTYTLDNSRIPSHQSPSEVAAEQLGAIIGLLPDQSDPPRLPALLLVDGYYSCTGFLTMSKNIPCDKLIRLAKNRVLYRSTPPKTGKRGRPREHGKPFKCHDLATQGEPDEIFEGDRLGVACWKNLHFKENPGLLVSVIRVERKSATWSAEQSCRTTCAFPSASNTKRYPRVSWLLFVGEQMPLLSEVPGYYGRRYSIEHGYRVDKQDLLWERVRLRTPEQFERFTEVVACVRNQLCLARDLGELRQPWESRGGGASPSQVRRGLRAIMAQLGTPARRCQPRGNSPGRAKGAEIAPAERFPVIRKAKKSNPKRKKLVQT